jgi:predicted metal-dependent phosphoesterase TrpH
LILKKLTDLKCPLELNDLLITSDDPSIGRPHIARAMVQKGYVKSIREAFLKYLKKGATAYMDKEKLHEAQAIQLIHQAGGIVILAHPGSLGYNSSEKLKNKIRKLKDLGLDGIEVYAPMNKGGTQDNLLKIARDLDLQISGGSDFHGSTKPELDLGCSKVPDKVYRQLEMYWKGTRKLKTKD